MALSAEVAASKERVKPSGKKIGVLPSVCIEAAVAPSTKLLWLL